MNISLVEQTLREFSQRLLDIQGVVLVSAQGQPITPSIGLEENTTLVMAGTLLQVQNEIATQCQWSQTEQISLQAKEGYLTLLPCTEDSFMLIKTSQVPTGHVEQEIKRIIRKLSAYLNGTETTISYPLISAIFPKPPHPKDQYQNVPSKPQPEQITPTPTYKPLNLHPDPAFINYCQTELTQFIGPIASLVCQRHLKQHPDCSVTELVEALAQKIPNPQQVQEFRQKISAWSLRNI